MRNGERGRGLCFESWQYVSEVAVIARILVQIHIMTRVVVVNLKCIERCTKVEGSYYS